LEHQTQDEAESWDYSAWKREDGGLCVSKYMMGGWEWEESKDDGTKLFLVTEEKAVGTS